MGYDKGNGRRAAAKRVLRCRRTLADLARLDEHVKILRAAASGADGVGLVRGDTREFVGGEVQKALGHLGCAFAILADACRRTGARKVEHSGKW
jgi:hypothetical protein